MNIGFAISGSFCTFSKIIPQIEILSATHAVTPVLSPAAAGMDTRFGKAADLRHRIKEICGRDPILTIPEAEPIGPKMLFDLLIVAPCTGNTLAKLAHGIADTAPTMAVKSHLRNGRPVLIAVSTNDGLGSAAENIGRLLNRKHIYFVPFGQDDPIQKPCSLVADFSKLVPAAEAAVGDEQLQPILI